MLILKTMLVFVCVIFTLRVILALYQPYMLVELVQRSFPEMIFYVPNEKLNHFALTFDDGPNPPYTDQILSILKLYDAKATFFLIGEKIQNHPEYIKIINDEGHQIANHSYTHRASVFMSNEEIMRSLNKTEEIIKQTSSPRFFRPTFGWIRPKSLKYARDQNYRAVLGSAYVSDPYCPPKWLMLISLKKMLRAGIIVVLHDGGGNRQHIVDILPDLLEYAKNKNLNSVTLDMLTVSKRSMK